ncbi:MAG: P44/Msp2 family outer membrane protein [Alphaproteobacteria bacterium]|nr:P44/Msp2 family outer membrane protein [Alphaproteobacteria bacterium]
MLNGFYNFFEPGTGVIPYMGMGFGTTRLRYDERIEMMNGEGLYTWHDKSLFTYMLGAGFLFEVNNNISLDVGYRYNRVANSTFKQRSYVDTDDDVGTLELLPLRNMATQSIMLTLKINLLERTIRKPYDGQFQSRP